MGEDLKFPIDFIICPNCNSTRRLAQTLVEREQEKGKIGKDVKPFLFQQQTVIVDPRKPVLSFPVLLSFFDVCLNCGTVYCVHIEMGQGAPQIRPPQGNMRPFGFPQGDPRLS